MANKIKIPVIELNDFLRTGDVTDVAINAVEDYYYVVLEMLQYVDDKNFIIDEIDDLWSRGHNLAEKSNAIKKSNSFEHMVSDVLAEVEDCKRILTTNPPFFTKLQTKWRLYWLRKKRVDFVKVLLYALINHPKKTREAKQKLIAYVKQKLDIKI